MGFGFGCFGGLYSFVGFGWDWVVGCFVFMRFGLGFILLIVLVGVGFGLVGLGFVWCFVVFVRLVVWSFSLFRLVLLG